MKQWIMCLLCGCAFFFSMLPAEAADTFTLDPSHTYVQWYINHFGFSNPSGKWMASGTVKLDEKNPQDSKVTATIKIADIVTGIKELDKHLQEKSFFDTAHFPTATFVSNKVDITGHDQATVYGILTLHGVSKPITLKVKLNKMGANPISNKQAVGFSATTQIKRSDFGMNAYLPDLSDEVKINIEAEGSKSS
jgi:polyisoprenoid-binding protein YceI